MALSWIRVDRDIARDPKVRALAFRLGVREAAAVGHCVLVFIEMAGGAKDGDLSEVSNLELESWARWGGKRGKFDAVFRELFAPDGKIKSWPKHNGDNIRLAEIEAERKRVNRMGDAENSENGKRRGTRHTTATAPVRQSTDGQDVLTTKNTPSTSPPGKPVELSQWPEFAALFTPRQSVTVSEGLARCDKREVPKLVRSILMWCGGGGTTPFAPTAAEITQGFAEYDGSGNPVHFWGFLDRIHSRMSAKPIRRGGGPSRIEVGRGHLAAFAAEDDNGK